MRTVVAFVALLGLVALTAADEPKKAAPKKDPPPKPAVTLKVGDAAPALKATKWLQGDEVKSFETGKVYIVEFWATWCGPCIVMMPHMAELQNHYRSKGVTIIGYTAKDPNNSAEKVETFVSKRGPKLGYTMAYADDRSSYDAWMRAAGRNGIPCCFVVGKDSKIAYIGHPMYLDVVLPKVVDGTWTADDVAGIDKIEADVNDMFKSINSPDADAASAALASFDKKHPELGKIPYFIGPRLSLLLKKGQFDEAQKMAEGLVEQATKQDDTTLLRTVSSVLRSPAGKEHKNLITIAVKAAEAMVKAAGENDALALVNLADTYFVAGDKARAKEFGKKAMAAAEKESPNLKRFIEQQTKKFEEN